MALANKLARVFLGTLSDSLYCQLQYLWRLRRWPDLRNPQSFNEQIQWIKLFHRDPLMKLCSDKWTVRDYVEEAGCGRLLIPLLGVYDKPEEVPFEELPSRFVLKVSHGSGMNILCRDKASLDRAKTSADISRWMKADFAKVGREWAYTGVVPRIVCEEFLAGEDGEPPADYKVHCFAGEPRFIQVDYARFVRHTRALYTPEWKRIACRLEYALEKNDYPPPGTLPDMLDASRLLAKPFPYVRVDLYDLRGRLYFGELTFYHGKGVERFTPSRYDRDFGKWLRVRDGKIGAA